MSARFFAVGDIHGHVETLKALLEEKISIQKGETLLFLGDYIDKGPDAKGVITYIEELKSRGVSVIALLGNHEAMFLDYLHRCERKSPLKDESPLRAFVSHGDLFLYPGNGGQSTAAQYVTYESEDDSAIEENSDTLPIRRVWNFSEADINFFNSLQSHHVERSWNKGKGVIFVHAGLSREALLKRDIEHAISHDLCAWKNGLAKELSMTWQREVDHLKVAFDALIVHGHWTRRSMLTHYRLQTFKELPEGESWRVQLVVGELESSLNCPRVIGNFLNLDTGIASSEVKGAICAVEFIEGEPQESITQEDIDG